jgi:hypothetical protein
LRSFVRSGFDIWSAGTTPQRSPVRSAAAVVKASTRGSNGLPTVARSVSSTERTNEPPQKASSIPAAAPSRASVRLSESSWASSRPRPAPSATRTASSRRRRSARARRRLATFAQAISRTIPATPPSHDATLAVSDPCGLRALWIGARIMRAFGSLCSRSAVACRYAVVATIAARSGVTPGFSRARIVSQT